jgi:thiol-disulfide isomerase/thioredoxin
VASSLDEVEGVVNENAGSESYQTEHMGMIFTEGFSFSGFERDLLFIGDGAGRFANLSTVSGLDDPNDGRAALVADFDDDGDPDLFVHNIARARHKLFRNDSRRGRDDDPGFVKVQVRGTSGAAEAPGAVVRMALPGGEVVAQLVSLGSGFVSQSAPEQVFGLGDLAGGELSVTWPGGATEAFGAVVAGDRVLLVEGEGTPRAVEARPLVFADPAPPGLRVDVGADLSSIVALDAAGEELTLDLTSDGETYLNFWATWCAACRQELPELVHLDGSEDARVVAVSVDVPEERAGAADVLAAQDARFRSVFLSPWMVEELVDVDRLALPTTLVLGPDGVVRRIIRGAIER